MMSTDGASGHKSQFDDMAHVPRDSSSRHHLGQLPLSGREGEEVLSISPLPSFSELQQEQNYDKAPRFLRAKLRISTSSVTISDNDEEDSSSSSIYKTPGSGFEGLEERWAYRATNHYHGPIHIQHIGNASFGDNYGILNQRAGHPNFTETLLNKLPNFEETRDPAKAVLLLAKTIARIEEDLQGNMDAVESRIASTAAQLMIVEKALDRWPQGAAGRKNPAIQEFKGNMSSELERLRRLQGSATARQLADHEHEKTQIAEIFENLDNARMRFELDTSIRMYDMVDAIGHTLKRSLKKDLEASDVADYKYVGKGKEKLLRVPCTPGTRVRILDMITEWANSGNSQRLFWLFGPAGSGKSTIAYTIARRFEMTVGVGDRIALGGNFFCSRQLEGARDESQIVRTIAYHLALKCEPFALALERLGRFETISQSVDAQLAGLLVNPWKDTWPNPHDHYLIVIDAVDELTDDGGSRFLSALLSVINDYDLPGLKFLVTSRSDPKLVKEIDSFERKELYRLQDVETEEVQADIKVYLEDSFPHFKGLDEMETLLTFADGLFICAATLARYLAPHVPEEQSEIIERFLPRTRNSSEASSKGQVTHLASLDLLYRTVILEAFGEFQGEIRTKRLRILYTFLCAAEPTTTAITA